jgi:hypothetical protein
MRKKAKITEQDLLDLGFERQQEIGDPSIDIKDWYYYTLDIADVCLITNDDEDAETDGWLVYFFDDVGIRFGTTEDLVQLVRLLKSNEI